MLDGRALPDPLQLHLPTVVTQVDRREVLADVAVALGRTLPVGTPVTVLDRLGDPDEVVLATTLQELPRYEPGPRTSLYLDPPPTGWYGLVTTNRRLRTECPWDREQTHHTLPRTSSRRRTRRWRRSLASTPTLRAAIPTLGPTPRWRRSSAICCSRWCSMRRWPRSPGAFGVEEVAEGIRRKLVRRHPHVFGEVEADDATTVMANWEQIKRGRRSASR